MSFPRPRSAPAPSRCRPAGPGPASIPAAAPTATRTPPPPPPAAPRWRPPPTSTPGLAAAPGSPQPAPRWRRTARPGPADPGPGTGNPPDGHRQAADQPSARSRLLGSCVFLRAARPRYQDEDRCVSRPDDTGQLPVKGAGRRESDASVFTDRKQLPFACLDVETARPACAARPSGPLEPPCSPGMPTAEEDHRTPGGWGRNNPGMIQVQLRSANGDREGQLIRWRAGRLR
jgi:translation initiation factor IF-2